MISHTPDFPTPPALDLDLSSPAAPSTPPFSSTSCFLASRSVLNLPPPCCFPPCSGLFSFPDHEGMSFMLSHVATVESISPSASGLLGGDRITIKGTGFPQDTSDANVSIAGIPCQVLKTADKEIVCVLDPYNASAHPPAGEDQPGDRGMNVSIWFEAVRCRHSAGTQSLPRPIFLNKCASETQCPNAPQGLPIKTSVFLTDHHYLTRTTYFSCQLFGL